MLLELYSLAVCTDMLLEHARPDQLSTTVCAFTLLEQFSRMYVQTLYYNSQCSPAVYV